MYLFRFQYTALTWVKEFVQLAGVGMLPFTSSILLSVLPCFAFEAENQQRILHAHCCFFF